MLLRKTAQVCIKLYDGTQVAYRVCGKFPILDNTQRGKCLALNLLADHEGSDEAVSLFWQEDSQAK